MDEEFGLVNGVAELVAAPRGVGAGDDLDAHVYHAAGVVEANVEVGAGGVKLGLLGGGKAGVFALVGEVPGGGAADLQA